MADYHALKNLAYTVKKFHLHLTTSQHQTHLSAIKFKCVASFMKTNDSVVKSLIKAIKVGLWLIPSLPLYVPTSLLYPFTSGRNFAFRIIVEIIFVLWLALVMLDRSYRPRRSELLYAFSLFIFLTFIANIFSPNPWRAFFSDYERMGGFVSVFHYYLYFLLLGSVFRKTRDWSVFFVTSLATSCITVFVALLLESGITLVVPGGIIFEHQIRAASTLGNSSYLAAYLLLHTWLAIIFCAQNVRQRKRMLAFGVLAGLCLVGIFLTANRSAVLSILISAISLVALSVYLGHNSRFIERIKKFFSPRIILVLSAIALFFMVERNYNVPASDTFLSRLMNTSVHDYSAEGTINTRLILWKMALKGAVERPILGWGQENFYLIFQKYFDPRLHEKEKHFDRAHNIYLDKLIEAGILGLLSYIFVWIATGKILIGSLQSKKLRLQEGYLFGALLLSYLLHISFHFDTFNTQFLFFAMLAYIQHRAHNKDHFEIQKGNPDKPRRLIVSSLALVSIVVFYWITIQPIREALVLRRAIIMAKSLHSGDKSSVDDTYKLFIRSLRQDALRTGDSDEHILREIATISQSPHVNNDDKILFIDLALTLLPETKRPNSDIRHLLTFAYILNSSQAIDEKYAGILEDVLSRALQLSPNKQDVYFELAQLHLNKGDKSTALNLLKKAWELSPRYTDAAANLLTLAIVTNEREIIEKIESSVILEDWNLSQLERIGTAHRMVDDYGAAFKIYHYISSINPRQPEAHFWCGVSEFHSNRFKAAQVHFEEALRLGGKRTDAQRFLDMLEHMKLK